jgi:small-conductance mechanosensitive channel
MNTSLSLPATLASWLQPLPGAAIAAAVAVVAALVLHLVLFRLLDKGARLSATTSDDVIVARLRQPARWSMIAVSLAIAQESDPVLAQGWAAVARFVEPALFGWMALALLRAISRILSDNTEGKGDKQTERSRKTRIALFTRMASFVIVLLTVALLLFAIPAVRNVGVTLLASAGLATLAFGMAAQPALKSLVAGLQIALTEPIRIDDYVVIDGEGGRVEDIRLSYVVIRTADERRVIVPTTKFIDGSFQNWSRVSSGITGSVSIPVKPDSAIVPIRAAFLALIAENKRWDGRTAVLSVAEAQVGSIELRLTISAKGPTDLAPLRAEVREGMLEWLRVEMPTALCIET